MNHDPINHPAHYQGNGLEAIEVIEDWQLGYHLGNAVKYILRAGKKGDRKQDLEKALWYVRRAMEQWPSGWEGTISASDVEKAFSLDESLSNAIYYIQRSCGQNPQSWKRHLQSVEGNILQAIWTLGKKSA